MDYGLVGGTFIFRDTEESMFTNTYTYGDIEATDEDITNRDFTRSKHILVNAVGDNSYDAGYGTVSTQSISTEDIILVTFWAKHNSSSSQVFAFAEESTTYEKQYFFPISFTPDWTQYYMAFKSTVSFEAGVFQAGFHLASQVQDIDIAGFAAINYGDAYELEDIPSSFSSFDYEGSEDDAPWRALAESRIENLRKADLNILIADINGNPISDATVELEMQQHEFGFGSALVTCRFPGNNCYDETYVEKVLDLDGKGHGFNECVNENALKWRAWEQEWLGTPEETVGAFEWLTAQGITMRGHNLFWPGEDYLPEDVKDNLSNIDYLRDRIDNRIEEIINHPQLSQFVRDWDILNEITTNRALENSFNNDPTLENGRKLYNEIYEKVKALDPELELYVNDYIVISDGSANLVNRYKGFLDELLADDVPFDGIGFQCHIGSVPNSIPKVEEVFNDFYQRYGKRMKVTEYDINTSVDEITAANYLGDLMTLTFSHPGMDAFIMWGFWDGNHWKQNAPMFNLDWTLKPSGEAFIQKVFNDWWTVDSDISDSLGKVEFRPFKGKHLITVTVDGKTQTVALTVDETESITIILDGVNAISELNPEIFKIFPNPVIDGPFQIRFPKEYGLIDLDIFNIKGKQVHSIKRVATEQFLDFDLSPGSYQLKLTTKNGWALKTFIKL